MKLVKRARFERSEKFVVVHVSSGLTMRMSHDEEGGTTARTRDRCGRAPRHWLNPFVGRRCAEGSRGQIEDSWRAGSTQPQPLQFRPGKLQRPPGSSANPKCAT